MNCFRCGRATHWTDQHDRYEASFGPPRQSARDLSPIVSRRLAKDDVRQARRFAEVVDDFLGRRYVENLLVLAEAVAGSVETSVCVGLADAYGERGLPLPALLPPVVEMR